MPGIGSVGVCDVAVEESAELEFRRAMSAYPTGVVVVTACVDDAPAGLSLGTFSSVSLRPPLVGFFVDRASTSWPIIRRAEVLRVNILASGQAETAKRFARSGGDKFSGVEWYTQEDGAPIIEGSVATLLCELEGESDAGDHYFVLCRVISHDRLSDEPPLVFFRGGFHGLAC